MRLEVTPKLLRIIAPRCPHATAEQWAEPITEAAWWFGIDTPLRLSWWLANGIYECNQFIDLVEEVSPKCGGYDGGCNFRGRGLGHVTHRRNYQALAGATKPLLGVDIGEQPELAAFHTASPWIWAAFWFLNKGNDLTDSGRFHALSAMIHRGNPNLPPLASTHHDIRTRFAARALRYFTNQKSAE